MSPAMTTIAVTGASGHLGRATVQFLTKRKVPAASIVLVVRDPSKVQDLAAQGFQVRQGDEIRVHNDSKDLLPIAASLESKTKPSTVRWLALDEGSRTGRVLERPGRADIPLAVQEQLIVELYSK